MSLIKIKKQQKQVLPFYLMKLPAKFTFLLQIVRFYREIHREIVRKYVPQCGGVPLYGKNIINKEIH